MEFYMKKMFLFSLVFMLFVGISKPAFSQTGQELKEQIEELKGQISGMDERLLTTESDVLNLKKIKISGYAQFQFEKYESNVNPKSTFFMRRVRIKTTYEAADGVKFVVQPDFVVNAVTLKDAYVVVNDPWTNTFQLWAGQFNRPNYEVEFSSSQRETPERSRLIRAIYAGEREVGIKLEANPSSIPLSVQLALFNGNFTGSQNKDIDNFKDIMARAVYSINMPASGIGIDLGAHAYIGNIRATSTKVTKSDYTADADVLIGDGISKTWFGGELRLYADILGGMQIKGEYITGSNTTPAADATKPNQIKDFSGFYVYLVKNIGEYNQFSLKYDNYDPNTKFSASEVGTKGSGSSDIAYNTLTLAWHHYWDDNIRISMAYEMPMNEKCDNLAAFKEDVIDNTFTLRIQAKF
jgi:hypothetical protein